MSSYQDIQNQIEALKVKAEEARKAEIAGGIAQIKEIMAKFGLTAEDLGLKGGKKAIRARVAAAAMYRDPASGKTWSGRGRKPNWFEGAEKL